MADGVLIWGGSKEDKVLEEELDRSGMGSDEFLNIWREIVSVVFCYFQLSFPISRYDSHTLFQYSLLQNLN